MADKLPTGMLQNTATGRYHPILFRPAPPPSGDHDLAAQRFRSLGHHTDGFDTLELAIEFIKQHEDWDWTGVLWEWDGADVPAMTQWFGKAAPVPA